jgi:hypothetical protein
MFRMVCLLLCVHIAQYLVLTEKNMRITSIQKWYFYFPNQLLAKCHLPQRRFNKPNDWQFKDQTETSDVRGKSVHARILQSTLILWQDECGITSITGIFQESKDDKIVDKVH